MSARQSQSQHRRQLLEARATAMRHQPTQSEAVLWAAIRGKRLGVQFRRQVCIGEYIADFYASSVRLVVEVDGGYHAERSAQDARRQRRLERAGYRVVRCTAQEVSTQLPLVLRRIAVALG